jgi:hypothetical protein
VAPLLQKKASVLEGLHVAVDGDLDPSAAKFNRSTTAGELAAARG